MAIDITTRENVQALIETQLIKSIQQDVPKESVFMRLATRLPNMTSNQTKMPVLDSLPMTYWVNGDTGFKGVSRAAWDNVFINAEEMAVIIPVSENVIADASYDIWGQINPRIKEAIGATVDAATIFGINRPASWPNDIITQARNAGNNVSPASKDYFDLIMGEGGVLDKVEQDGYSVNGAVAIPGIKAKLRGLRTTDGMPIFTQTMQESTRYALDGSPLYIMENGAFDPKAAQLIVGDFSKAVYSIRQDVTVKILEQAVIQDPATKEIIYNLAQQDMIALRVVFRMGWALPKPATAMDPNREGCPFAYLEPSIALPTQTVTITVKDGVDTIEERGARAANAVEGAAVNFNGSIKKTNSSGQAVFSAIAGDYSTSVKKNGYQGTKETIKVESSPVNKTIVITKNAE